MEGLFGLISNTFSTTMIHPIDVIKTNYQVARTSKPQTVPNIIKSMWRSGGFRSFYRGIGPNLGTYPIFWGVYFQMGKHKLSVFENKHANRFVNSFVAGNIASFVANPLFVVKIRLQTRLNRGYGDTIKNIYHNSGVRGFYKGLPSTMINNFKLGIQFPMYDYIYEKSNSISFSSATAKLISSTILYPLDLIRVNQRNSDIKLSIKDVAKNVYRSEGIRGFYRGALLYNCVSTPNFILMMVSMEFLRNRFS